MTKLRVLRLPEPTMQTADLVGEKMREAREAGGLDWLQAAQRINLALGSRIVTPPLVELWESGREVPDAQQLIAAIRLAGPAAAAIFASLA